MGTTDRFQEVIESYLDKRAESDEMFAEKYVNPRKSLKECCKYILQEVKKSGRECYSDDEVYGLAVHYYDEAELGKIEDTKVERIVVPGTLTEEDKIRAKQLAMKAEIEKEKARLEEAKKKRAEKKPKQVVEQPSLF